MKIKAKIILSFLIIYSLMITLVGVVTSTLNRQSMTEEATRHLETAAQSRVNHLQSYFSQQSDELNLITSRTKLRSALASYNQDPNPEDYSTLKNIINDAASSLKKIERICILDLEGKVIVSSDHKEDNSNCNDMRVIQAVTSSNYINILEYNGNYKIYVAGPLILDEQLIGMAVSVIGLDEIQEIADDNVGMGETGEVLIAIQSKDGTPVFINTLRFAKTNDAADVSAHLPMQAALSNIEGVLDGSYRDYRNHQVIAIAKYLSSVDMGLIAKIDLDEAQYSRIGLINSLIILIGTSLIIFLILSYLVSHYLTLPIQKLQLGTELIEQGDLNHKVSLDTQDEIGMLSRSFDKMVATLRKSRAEVDEKVEIQTRDIQMQAKDMFDQQTAILNILEDVEDEKKNAEIWALDLQKFKSAVEGASDHIVITDMDGMVLYANPAVENISGFSNKEVVGNKCGCKENWGGQMEQSFYVRMWKTIKIDKKPFEGEIRNRRKGGDEYVAQARISPILNDKGEVQFFIGVERDITKAKQVDKMKTEFLSLASHQLRTPLSAMKWFLEMLLSGDAGALTDEQKEFVDNINQSNERMISLVNALLNVSRIESGRIIVDPKPTDLVQLVKDIVDILSIKSKERNINIILSANDHMPLVSIDPKLVHQVYLNLLTNAIKYTPKGGEVTIFLSTKDDVVLSQISDTGYGIPPEAKGRIFSKFYRADNIVRIETDGNGLGLYLAKAIVDSSQGKIWYESEVNKGTTFWFTLPLKGVKPKKGEVSIDN